MQARTVEEAREWLLKRDEVMRGIRRGVFDGVDLRKLAARFWKLDAMRAEGPPPHIKFRACDRSGTGGVAYTRSKRITMSIGAGDKLENVLEVLLHELVHCACPPSEHHGTLFTRRFIASAREAFDIDLDVKLLLGIPVGQHSRRAYAIGEAVRLLLSAKQSGQRFRDDASLRPDAPKPKKPRNIIDERKKHAEEMLAKWQRRTIVAKTREKAWKRKVAYYEKRELLAAGGRK